MTGMQSSTQEQLRRIVDQIERLEEEKKALAADISDKLKEAKNLGFDTKILRKVLALRKKSQTERTEEEQLIDTYLHALGGLPLGDWADAREEEHA